MTEDLGDDVDRHAVFDRQCSERMPGAVYCQVFRDIAYPGQFLQIGIHLRVGGNGQQSAPRFAGFVGLVFLQNPSSLRQQRHPTHHRRLFSGLVNPLYSLFVRGDMLPLQVIRIRKGQTCQGAETEYVPDAIQSVVGHRIFQ